MDTNTLLIIVIAILAGAVAYLIYVNQKSKKPTDDLGLQLLQNQLSQLTQTQEIKLERLIENVTEQRKEVNDQLFRTQTTLQKQLESSLKDQKDTSEHTQKAFKDIATELTKLGETNKQVVGFAGQLQSLENILKNPKQRGILGEYFLESVLKNVLPPDTYKFQYRFANGEIVDALILTREGNICIDAKFSLNNYERLVNAENETERSEYERMFRKDLQNRIDETSKYIRPTEGTLDFAFMFIPADGLYYDLLVQKVGVLAINSVDLIEYAFKKRVIIVSPTTLFAYLQTVLQGLRALKIEESTKQIQQNVLKLQKHLKSYEDYFNKVGGHLSRTVSAYNDATKEMGKVDKDVIRITGDEALQLELSAEIDRPANVE
jgi:DNA recombination protein RmuC